MPQEYKKIAAEAAASGRPEHELELEVLGVSHAEIGAYLLGVWGVPFSIVETTAYHHAPGNAVADVPPVLAAVHLAAALVDANGQPDAPARFDRAFLERAGLLSELPSWQVSALDYFARLATPPCAGARARAS